MYTVDRYCGGYAVRKGRGLQHTRAVLRAGGYFLGKASLSLQAMAATYTAAYNVWQPAVCDCAAYMSDSHYQSHSTRPSGGGCAKEYRLSCVWYYGLLVLVYARLRSDKVHRLDPVGTNFAHRACSLILVKMHLYALCLCATLAFVPDIHPPTQLRRRL
jgi:hypothetical protein